MKFSLLMANKFYWYLWTSISTKYSSSCFEMFMTFCFFIISVGFWPIFIIPCFLSWRPFTSREPRKSTTSSFPSRKYTYKCHWWLGDHHVAALHGINAVSVDSIAWEWIWNMLLDSAQSARRTANYLASTGRATFTSITASPSVCNPPLPLQSLSRCLSVAPEDQLSHSGPHALSRWLFYGWPFQIYAI